MTTTDKIMALIESYRCAGGREEHWAKQDALRAEIDNLVMRAEHHVPASPEVQAAVDAAVGAGAEPLTWVDLQKEADGIVRSKSLWKRFIDGTPLANDIACWMADFAQQYAAPARVPNWIRAIDEELVSTFIGVANVSDTYKVAKKKLGELIDWHVQVAIDPAVNGGYVLVPARVPLTKTRVGNYLRRHVHGEVGMYRNGFKDGVAFAEAAHDIGGGK